MDPVRSPNLKSAPHHFSVDHASQAEQGLRRGVHPDCVELDSLQIDGSASPLIAVTCINRLIFPSCSSVQSRREACFENRIPSGSRIMWFATAFEASKYLVTKAGDITKHFVFVNPSPAAPSTGNSLAGSKKAPPSDLESNRCIRHD